MNKAFLLEKMVENNTIMINNIPYHTIPNKKRPRHSMAYYRARRIRMRKLQEKGHSLHWIGRLFKCTSENVRVLIKNQYTIEKKEGRKQWQQ